MGENERNINLNGFLVFSEMTSEGIYNVVLRIDNLTKEQIENLRHELEDLYIRVDEEYMQRKGRIPRRSINIKYVATKERDGDKIVRKEVPVLSFSVAPSRITSMLKTTRKYYYMLLHDYAIKVPIVRNFNTALLDVEGYRSSSSGFKTQKNLYLLPEKKTEKFMKEFEKIEKMYRGIHEIVRDFAYSPYVDELNEILSRYDLPTLQTRTLVEREPSARVNLMSITMDDTMVHRWMENSPTIARKIMEAQGQLMARVIQGLMDEIKPVIEAIKKNILDWINGRGEESRDEILAEIETLQDKMESIGVGRLSALDGLKNLITGDVEITEEEVHLVDKFADEIDGRLKSFVAGDNVYVHKKKVKAMVKKAIKHIDDKGLEIEF